MQRAINQYWHSFIETPQRLWRWSQHHPFESVGYGMVLLIVSLGAQYLITIAAAVAILGGIYKLFIQPLPK